MRKLLILFLLLITYVSYGQQVATDILKQGDYTVTGNVTLKASNSIILKPNSWIKPGANFSALIIQNPYTLLSFSNENYVFTREYQKATQVAGDISSQNDVIESITYFDGLGRAKQSIGIRQSPLQQDIVTHIAYDTIGRQDKEFLPYVSPTQNGQMITGDIAAATQTYYKTHYAEDFAGVNLPEVNAYSQKEFEASPLNRILKQAAPGEDWKLGNGHEIKFVYSTNIANEVRLYGVTTSFADNTYMPTLQENGVYDEGELHKTITKDENWQATQTYLKDHTTEEFKNKQGQIVLKRTYNQNVTHDTYYVYDDFGNLSYVLPPKVNVSDGVSSEELSELCYQYVYDYRNRLVEKKIPGKGKEYIIYDNLDRPVLTQDANLKTDRKWLFTKYDAFGRVAYTGMHTTTIDRNNRIAMQAYFSSQNNTTLSQYETKVTTGAGGYNTYYTNTNFPNNSLEIHTINYYDNYEFDMQGLSNSVPLYKANGETSTNRLKGLATGTKVKVLGTGDWITTITYYDDKARPIHVYSKNEFLNTVDIVESKLDAFTGRVEETKTTHKKTGQTDIITVDTFEYDHVNRLLEQTQKINNQSIEVIAKNEYDELGQLKSKAVGGKTTQNRLQTVDYAYNVRGWLKNINQDTHSDNDLFNFSIKYNNATDPSKALFNGNISQTNWNSLSTNTTNNPVSNQYTYTYDALNRILNATDNTNNYNLQSVTYDKNGNIKNLIRNGHINTGATSFGTMDDLVYTYDQGNKLKKVIDNGNGIFGFKEGTNGNNDYTYDANGNMLTDANKGISNISYNHLNLPVEVTFDDNPNKRISYTYDTAGMKLRKVVKEGSTTTVTDYAGNYIYKNNELEFFNHPEGYVSPTVTSSGVEMKYTYQYKDHLGNVRLSYADANNDGVITAGTEIIEESNYYPFGLKHKGYNNTVSSNGNSAAQKWGYTGKEHQEEFGLDWVDIMARNYDPSIGRFFNVDPMADSPMQVDKSPFAYTWNNPIKFTDPDGMHPDWMGDGPTYDSAGNYAMGDRASSGLTSVDDTSTSKGKAKKILVNKEAYMVTTVDFIPEKDKAGNELRIGSQIITTEISERNTFLIIGNSIEYRKFEVNSTLWRTTVSSLVKNINTTFTMTTQEGMQKDNLSKPITLINTNVRRKDIPQTHKDLIAMMEYAIENYKSSLAVAYKDGHPIPNSARNTLIALTLATINARVTSPQYTYAPITIGSFLSQHSITKTPASRLRLIYEYKRNYGKKFYRGRRLFKK